MSIGAWCALAQCLCAVHTDKQIQTDRLAARGLGWDVGEAGMKALGLTQAANT